MKFSVFQVSRLGGRAKNEDRMGYCYTRESGLFLLADGMGGHPQGEVAAQIAIQTATAMFQRQAHHLLERVDDFLVKALMGAHHQIIRYASDKGMLDTPRTTFVAAVLQHNSATWIHSGDSRLYLVRDGALVMRTRDHSFVERPDLAAIASDPSNRNVLFTCLGSPSRPVFEMTGPIALKQGDKILMCSDGLWDNLEEEEIVYQLTRRHVTEAAPELVERALRNGGEDCDNVTVIAFEWESPDVFEPTRGQSTISDVDGGFASSIQATIQDGSADDLDDIDIERSIAEINEAIRRSVAKKR